MSPIASLSVRLREPIAMMCRFWIFGRSRRITCRSTYASFRRCQNELSNNLWQDTYLSLPEKCMPKAANVTVLGLIMPIEYVGLRGHVQIKS
ncbi:hypothetical protein K443DRAFT_645975 [Laccaria amethystina LaAM-08-1]|uniref:Uncharacterized protein n=1 Tax=Laccaria amethystina LaAM-08-1 TaxID=1095629 RepID=A0A0C9XIH6_9AGAR|nr:hypothetical protein K443DRAFT_645975 [Laccaria amethystina LaAM-08-1]